MALPYISALDMADYRQSILLFAKGSKTLECIRSHYYMDHSGRCDLTGAKDQDEIFVLANRTGTTIKVGAQGMQIVANVVDVTDTDQWYQHLKDQRKILRQRVSQEAQKREQERKLASRGVLLRKKTPNTIVK